MIGLAAAVRALASVAGVPAHAPTSRASGWTPLGPRLGLATAALIALVAFRIVQPITFQGPGLLGILPNPTWLGNMVEISDLQSGARDFPPGHQWTNRTPILFALGNMVIWGLGLPLGIAAWAGVAFAAYELLRRRKLAHLLPVTFVVVVFLYQAVQWVPSMRYFVGTLPVPVPSRRATGFWRPGAGRSGTSTCAGLGARCGSRRWRRRRSSCS